MRVALMLVGVLILLATGTLLMQMVGYRKLRHGSVMADEDRRYLRAKHRRRLLMGINLFAIAGMIGWTYLSGMEAQAEALTAEAAAKNLQAAANPPPVDPAVDPDVGPAQPEMKPETREFIRFYSMFWILTLLLVFLLVMFAFFDLMSTRAYAMRQLRRIREDHRVLLERDLAVYRSHRSQDRRRFTAPEPSDDE